MKPEIKNPSETNTDSLQEHLNKLNKLEAYYLKLDEAMLGEDPQMKIELIKLKKKTWDEIVKQRKILEQNK